MSTDFLHVDQHWEMMNELRDQHAEELLQLKAEMAILTELLEGYRVEFALAMAAAVIKRADTQ